MKKPSLLSFFVLAAGKFNNPTTAQRLLLALFLCCAGYNSFGAVTVAPATTATICPTLAVGGGATAYTTLSNIMITEGLANDISLATTIPDQLVLNAPTGWQFAAAPTVTFTSGEDITSFTCTLTSSTTITINIFTSGTTHIDQITISNLQVEATSTSSFPGSVTATTALGITGITTGTSVPPATPFASFLLNPSPTVPSVTISGSPSGAICYGTGVTFTPAPVNGGTSPTYQWYVNGTLIGPGSTYSSSTLTNGSMVSTVLTSNATGCVYPATASSNTVTVTVNPAPATVTASGGGTYCGSAVLTASNGGSGTIYYEGTTSGGTATTSPSATVTVASSGTYYFRAQSAAGCWGTEGSVTVTINPLPTAVTVTGGGAFCGTSPALVASGGSGGTIYFQGTTSNGTSTATPSSSQTVSSSGIYYFNSESAAGCWGPQGSATVTINPVPTAVTVSGGGSFCGGTTTLVASGGTGGTIYYEGTTSGGTSTTTPASSQVVSASGTYYFNSETAAGCWGTQGSATVSINTVPTAVTVSGGGTYCGGTPTLTAAGGTGGTMYFQGTTSGGTSTTTASSSQSVSSSGTYYFNSESAAGCWGAQGSATVTINIPPTANAGTPQTICSGGSVTLAGTIGGSATSSTWSAPSGSFSDPTSLTPTYTPTITSGTVTLTLTSNNPAGAPCTAATSTVVITVNPAATVNAGVAQTVCSNGFITLAGSIGGGATSATWSAPSGVFSNPNALNSIYTPTITSGNVTLTLTTNTPSAPCTVATSMVVITVDQAATDNSGTPQVTCAGSTITLSGSTGGGATSSLWTASSGTFSNASSVTSTYTPSIAIGNVTLTLTTNDPDGPGPCTAAVSSVVVTVDAAATANAGVPQTVCSNGTITLAGSIGGSASSSTWTSSAGGVFSNISSPTSTYTPAILTGNVTLTLTTNTPPGACPAATSSVLITVNEAALVNAGPSQTVCAGSSLVLDGSEGGSTTTTTWTAPSGTLSDAFILNATYTPSIASGNVVLTLTGNDPDGPGPCTASTSTVTVTVNPMATANAGAPQTVCANGNITLAGSMGGSATSSTWSAPSGTFSNVASLTSTYTPGITSGTVILTLTTNDPDGAGPCTAATSTVVITVNPAATDNAGPNQTVCAGGSITLAGTIGGSATSSTWSAASGSFSDATSLTATYTPIISSGTVVLTLTTNDPDGTGPCGVATSTMTVTVNPAATANAGLPQSVCAGGTVTLAGSIGGSATSTSWNAASGTFSNVNSLTSTYTPSITGGVVTLTLTTNNPGAPCAAASSTVAITVNPAPAAVTVTGGGAYCTSETLTASNGGDGTIYYQGATSGGSSILSPSATEVETVSGTYYFRAESAFGCWGTQGSASVIINSIPAAYTITGGGGYCTGGSGLAVGLSGSQSGISYQLYNDYSPVGPVVIGSGGAITFGLQTAAGFYTVIATNTGTSCTNNMTGGVSIVLLPLPNVYSVTGGGSYCAGGTGTDVATTGSDIGVNYQLFIGGVATGTAIAGTGVAIDFGLQTTAGTYTIVGTSASSGCNSTMSGSATVSINVLPTIYAVTGGGAQCAGGSGVAVGLSNSQIGVNYQLYNGPTVTGLPDAGTGAAFSFGLMTAAGTYSVSATNATTGCSSNMTGDAIIIINPLPVAYAVTGGGGYCTGGTGVDIGLSNSASGVNYQLFDGTTGLTTVAGTGSAITYGLQTTSGSYTVVATNTVTACSNVMGGSATVTINPLPNVYNVTGGGAYCAGDTGIHVDLSGSDLGVNYQIYVGGVLTGLPVAGTGTAGPLDLGLQTTAGTYTVTATNAATSCTNNMNGSVIVSVNPAPMPFTVTGGGSDCSGGAGFDIGLSGSTLGAFSYQLYDDGMTVSSAIAGSGSALDFGMQTAAGTYTVVATNTGTGCTANMLGSAIINVYPLPNVYTVSGGGNYCSGGSGVDITTSSSDIGTNYQVFIGGVPVGLPVAGTGSGLNILETGAGTYTIVATNGATGCNVNMSGSAAITVNPLPAAISGTTDICVGTNTTLSDASGAGVWSSSNAAIGSIDPATGIVAGVSAGIYNITYTLTSTTCFTANIDTVSAMPTVGAITGPATVCTTTAVTLSDASAGGVWTSSNIAVASVGSLSGIVTGVAPGTVIFTYSIAPLPGCSASATFLDTVKTGPIVGSISGSTSLCAGLTISLSDATSGGAWTSSNTSVATVDSAGTITGVSTGSAVISYTVIGSGCAASVISAISVGAAMPAAFALPFGSATVCNGTAVNLSVATSGPAAVTYQWAIGGSPIAGATNSSYTTFTPGLYTAIISNGSCTETLPAINVLAQPNPIISKDSTAGFLYTGSFATYQWLYNDTLIPGATSNIIQEDTTVAGAYRVLVSDGNGCYDTSAEFIITIDSSLAAANAIKGGNISVYPNPASSILHINAPVKVFITITGTDGRIFMDKKQAVTVNISGLANGMYFVSIYDENYNLLKTDHFVKIQ
jgi:hypothetical protein